MPKPEPDPVFTPGCPCGAIVGEVKLARHFDGKSMDEKLVGVQDALLETNVGCDGYILSR